MTADAELMHNSMTEAKETFMIRGIWGLMIKNVETVAVYP
jgi:hypothetical protein